jgi:uncharacterized protein YutE (UPF0331/DUF86 family)
MSPGQVRAAVVADRLAQARVMVASIRRLPLDSLDAFTADPDRVAAAESYLRRGLEAILDAGRHVLSKGFAVAVTEYKAIADQLASVQVLGAEDAGRLRDMAGYRNRLTHFYHDVTPDELYRICTGPVADIEAVAEAIERWLRAHPERVDLGE